MKLSKRWIKARIEKGIFKGAEIDIQIGKRPETTKVFMNKKQINNVKAIHIHLRAGECNEVNLELVDY